MNNENGRVVAEWAPVGKGGSLRTLAYIILFSALAFLLFTAVALQLAAVRDLEVYILGKLELVEVRHVAFGKLTLNK